MPTIQREKIVSYSPKQMFDLVNQIETYPDFIPYCKAASILKQTQDEIHAQLDFAKGGLHKSFTTCNRLQENKMIEIKLLDGPFQQLEGFWHFEPVPEGCRIRLNMEFEFSNKWVATLFGPVFNTMTNKLVDVFAQQAQKIYG